MLGTRERENISECFLSSAQPSCWANVNKTSCVSLSLWLWLSHDGVNPIDWRNKLSPLLIHSKHIDSHWIPRSAPHRMRSPHWQRGSYMSNVAVYRCTQKLSSDDDFPFDWPVISRKPVVFAFWRSWRNASSSRTRIKCSLLTANFVDKSSVYFIHLTTRKLSLLCRCRTCKGGKFVV